LQVGRQTLSADFYDLNRCSLGLFTEDGENNDRIRRDVVDDSPRLVMIADSQLVAPAPDCWHWSRMGQTQPLPLLEPPEKQPSFQAGLIAERRGFHFAL
jgi:hypothetical protein